MGRYTIPTDLIYYTNSKSKRYFCWRRCRLPQRMYNTPRRLNIIIDLEMVLFVSLIKILNNNESFLLACFR